MGQSASAGCGNGAEAEKFIRQQAKVSDETPVETVEFSDFFHPDAPDPNWYGQEEKAQAAKYRHLISLLECQSSKSG